MYNSHYFCEKPMSSDLSLNNLIKVPAKAISNSETSSVFPGMIKIPYNSYEDEKKVTDIEAQIPQAKNKDHVVILPPEYIETPQAISHQNISKSISNNNTLNDIVLPLAAGLGVGTLLFSNPEPKKEKSNINVGMAASVITLLATLGLATYTIAVQGGFADPGRDYVKLFSKGY